MFSLHGDRDNDRNDERKDGREDGRANKYALQSGDIERCRFGTGELVGRDQVRGQNGLSGRLVLLVVEVNVVSCLLNFDGALVRRVRVAERDCPSRLPIVVVGFCLLEGQRRVACYIEAYAGVAGGFG
jgi:hypothetical protein